MPSMVTSCIIKQSFAQLEIRFTLFVTSYAIMSKYTTYSQLGGSNLDDDFSLQDSTNRRYGNCADFEDFVTFRAI